MAEKTLADDRPHSTDQRECWCDPEVLQPCPECEDGEPEGCWRCQGRGLVDQHDPLAPVIVSHRYE